MFHSLVLNCISSSSSSEGSRKGPKSPDPDYSPYVTPIKSNQPYIRRTDDRDTEHRAKGVKNSSKEVTLSNGNVKRENHAKTSHDSHEYIEVHGHLKVFTESY